MVDKRKVKSLGELTAYERWELPNISADGTMRSVVTDPVEKVKPLTAEDIENIRQQAYKDGFDEARSAGLEAGMQEGKNTGYAEGLEQGKKDGYDQGIQQAQAEIDVLKQQLASLINQMHAPLEAQSELVHEVLLNVVVALSRSVIHEELSINDTIIKDALSSVVESLPEFDGGAVLSVNNRDYVVVNEIISTMPQSFKLVVDDSLVNGGFKIKTANQLIDYTIEKRFQKAVQSMLSNSLVSHNGEQEIPSSIGALSDYSTSTLHDEINENESGAEPIEEREERQEHDQSSEDSETLDDQFPGSTGD